MTNEIDSEVDRVISEIVTKALKKNYADISRVFNVKIKKFGSNGENYCSDVYRVEATITTASESYDKALVVKIMKDEVLESDQIIETLMYESILSKLEKIATDLKILNPKFSPRLFGIDFLPNQAFIMEDLNASGYELGNRFKGLDFDQTKIIMKKIAQFHAVSMILLKEDTSVSNAIGPSPYQNGVTDAIGRSITYGMLEQAYKVVSKWEGFEEIAKKVQLSIQTFNDRIKPLANLSKCKVKVLSHGDLWVNNFLFNAELNDVIMLDFQDCHVGSPGYDIQRFLYTSVQLEVIQMHRFDLLRHYYKSLREVLEVANFPNIPSWQIIMEEVRVMEFFGYYSVACELPFCCMSREVGAGFETCTFSDPIEMPKRAMLMYQNKRVLETLRYALDHFNELGVLD